MAGRKGTLPEWPLSAGRLHPCITAPGSADAFAFPGPFCALIHYGLVRACECMAEGRYG